MTTAVLERAALVDALLEGVAAARAGHGGVVLVEGEAGIGKSSLLRAFLAALDRSVRTLVGAVTTCAPAVRSGRCATRPSTPPGRWPRRSGPVGPSGCSPRPSPSWTDRR